MKYWMWFSIVCLATAYAVMAVIAYSLFWPVQTLVINNFSQEKPIQITNTVVNPGDRLEYQLDYCKYTDAPSTVHRTMIDGQIITLTDTQGQLPAGCHVVTVKTAIVPTTINPGKYYLDVTVSYRVSLLRTVYIHYHTTYFTVVKGHADVSPPGGETIIITH